MSSTEGRQSPPPSQQKPEQLHEPPASGHQFDESSREEQSNVDASSQLKGLTSNPQGPLDDEVQKKFTKTGAGKSA